MSSQRAFSAVPGRSHLPPLLAALALASLTWSCGGATPKAHAPNRHSDAAASGDNDTQAPDDTPEAPQAPSCDDGTCFSCGNGICPKGFYCDQKAPGGPACSWLPKCAKQASCSCVQHVLGSGCSCDEKNGGVYVDCQ